MWLKVDTFKQKLNFDRQIVYLDNWFIEFYMFSKFNPYCGIILIYRYM